MDKTMRMEPMRLKSFQAPAGSQRLFDLVKPKNDKFLNTFYFAMKDTL